MPSDTIAIIASAALGLVICTASPRRKYEVHVPLCITSLARKSFAVADERSAL
jgi:hypothetical protein